MKFLIKLTTASKNTSSIFTMYVKLQPKFLDYTVSIGIYGSNQGLSILSNKTRKFMFLKYLEMYSVYILSSQEHFTLQCYILNSHIWMGYNMLI